MGCLTTQQVSAIKSEIAEIDAMIVVIKAAYTASLTNAEVEIYRFDSGDGSQRVERRSPRELKEQWDDLASSRARLQRKLDGTSNVNMNLRRRRGTYGRYYR